MTSTESSGLPWEIAFAANVRSARERLGWSQTELAKRLSARALPFHQQQIQRIETGTRPIRLNEAVILSEILGTDIDAMMSPPDEEALRLALFAAIDRLAYIASDIRKCQWRSGEELDALIRGLQDMGGGNPQTEFEGEVRQHMLEIIRFRQELRNIRFPLSVSLPADEDEEEALRMEGRD